MNKLPKALAKKRDDAAEKLYPLDLETEPVETEPVRNIFNLVQAMQQERYKAGYAQCYKDVVESEELKSVTSKMYITDAALKSFVETQPMERKIRELFMGLLDRNGKALTKWQQFIAEYEKGKE